MPIRPENRDLYPADWRDISLYIRILRANCRCECDGRCGRGHTRRCGAVHERKHPVTGSRVILQTAHLDHNPANCLAANLMAMCQRCHTGYDCLHARTQAEARRSAA